jgi:hypothetical protein
VFSGLCVFKIQIKSKNSGTAEAAEDILECLEFLFHFFCPIVRLIFEAITFYKKDLPRILAKKNFFCKTFKDQEN